MSGTDRRPSRVVCEWPAANYRKRAPAGGSADRMAAALMNGSCLVSDHANTHSEFPAATVESIDQVRKNSQVITRCSSKRWQDPIT